MTFSRGHGVQLFDTFAAIESDCCPGNLFVDIPMGLPSGEARELEPHARRLLPGKASSIFSVPCRDAVYATSYQQACSINQDRCGRKLSLQSWYICPKIREADQYLQSHDGATDRFFESHPELCFHLLGKGAITETKKRQEGQEQRLSLLCRFNEEASDQYHEALGMWRRREVARDDILDAMVLSLLGEAGWSLIQVPAQKTDELGIPVRMAVPFTDSPG